MDGLALPTHFQNLRAVQQPESQLAPDAESQILQLVRQPQTLERGFRLLLKTYQERLYWHIRRLVHTHEATDEVLQNTFIKIYRGLPQFRGEARLYTWIYRIATNESLSFLAAQQRRHTESLDDPDQNYGRQLPADAYLDAERAQALLEKAIQLLPDKQRVVFTMRYYQETPYEEMSAILETSVGALKASYHHAAKKIEAYLKDNL